MNKKVVKTLIVVAVTILTLACHPKNNGNKNLVIKITKHGGYRCGGEHDNIIICIKRMKDGNYTSASIITHPESRTDTVIALIDDLQAEGVDKISLSVEPN